MAIKLAPGQPKRTGHARVMVTTASAAGLLMLWAGSHLAGTSSVADTTGLSTILRTQLQLSNSELSALTRGQPVAKTLPATMNREMTTAGAVRIRSDAMWRFVNQFKTLEGFKTSQFVLQIQKFSDPPQLSQLDSLIVDEEDIESLRECRVGACDVQLAADVRRTVPLSLRLVRLGGEDLIPALVRALRAALGQSSNARVPS